jgi:4a-hydroxytetrahydrobiopterin dehydratase
MNADDLRKQKCAPQTDALTANELPSYLAAVQDWHEEGGKIVRRFRFENYYRTLAFVNAAAWVAHTEDHHSEMTVTYNTCAIRYDTHSVNGGHGGLSINDFICAAKIDALFDTAATN